MRDLHNRPRVADIPSGEMAGDFDQADVISYIAAITNDLRRLARRNRLDTLAYLLDMAQLEADVLKAKKPKDD